MPTTTRVSLVEAAFVKSLLSRGEVADLVGQAIDEMGNALVAGEAVRIFGFASFTPKDARARIGRNPKRPGEEHTIPPHRRIAFAASGELKQQVQRGRTK